MKSFTINQNDSNQRVDKFIKKVCPTLPLSLMQKYIRLKRIKVNKSRCENNQVLNMGDILELYINDEFFQNANEEYEFLSAGNKINIIYEDKNIILVDKAPGLVVHEDEDNEKDNLINRIKHYLYDKKEYNPDDENSFAPALCNRIDRNTGGIVIAAKNAATLRVMNKIIKERLIDKYYLCIIQGAIAPKSGEIKGYIRKDEVKNEVKVFSVPTSGAKIAITKYRTIETKGKYSLLEVELLTGRTHQIRAQMASVGHPLVGDSKYGFTRDNRASGYKSQALYSYRLVFHDDESLEHLGYLNGKSFKVESVWFKEDFEKGLIN